MLKGWKTRERVKKAPGGRHKNRAEQDKRLARDPGVVKLQAGLVHHLSGVSAQRLLGGGSLEKQRARVPGGKPPSPGGNSSDLQACSPCYRELMYQVPHA